MTLEYTACMWLRYGDSKQLESGLRDHRAVRPSELVMNDQESDVDPQGKKLIMQWHVEVFGGI